MKIGLPVFRWISSKCSMNSSIRAVALDGNHINISLQRRLQPTGHPVIVLVPDDEVIGIVFADGIVLNREPFLRNAREHGSAVSHRIGGVLRHGPIGQVCNFVPVSGWNAVVCSGILCRPVVFS